MREEGEREWERIQARHKNGSLGNLRNHHLLAVYCLFVTGYNVIRLPIELWTGMDRCHMQALSP